MPGIVLLLERAREKGKREKGKVVERVGADNGSGGAEERQEESNRPSRYPFTAKSRNALARRYVSVAFPPLLLSINTKVCVADDDVLIYTVGSPSTDSSRCKSLPRGRGS